MKHSISFKLIAAVLAIFMLLPSVVLAEGAISIFDPQGESETRDPVELTDLDRAVNAEGSELHFETSGEYPFEVSEYEEPDAVTEIYGERTVALAEISGEEVELSVAIVDNIFYSGSLLTFEQFSGSNFTPFEEAALGTRHIDGVLYYTGLRLDNTTELPWVKGGRTLSAGVINGNYGQEGLDASLSSFSASIEEMNEGEYIRFNYCPQCRPGVDHFRFYVNDELALDISVNSSNDETFVYTCQQTGKYIFRWEFERGEFEEGENQSVISTSVTVSEGDALIWDWMIPFMEPQWCDYSLYIDGVRVKSTVMTGRVNYDGFTNVYIDSIQSDIYIFRSEGDHTIEWRTMIDPKYDDYFEHILIPRANEVNASNIRIMLDEVRVLPAGSFEDEFFDLNTVLNTGNQNLNFISTGRLRWIASEFDGEACAEIGQAGGGIGAYLTNYTAKLETSVYLNKGMTLSYKKYMNQDSAVPGSVVLVNGVQLAGHPYVHQWFSQLNASACIPGGGGYGVFTFTAPKDDYYTFTFCVCMPDMAANNLRIFDIKVGYGAEDTESSPYLNAALNAENGDLEFYSPNMSWVSDYYEYASSYSYAPAIVDGRYVGVNTNQGDHQYTGEYIPSTVCTDAYMSAGSQLRFDYRLSTETFDCLELWINDELLSDFDHSTTLSRYHGSTEWESYTWTAPADGSYNIRWTYLKDICIAQGYDSAWLDDVELIGVVPPEESEPTEPPVLQLSELAQAMNAPGCTVEYENDSEYPWIVTELDGATVAKSNHTDPEDGYHQSYVTTTLNVKAGDELSFDYLVSTEEDCDWFIFYVNDEDMLWNSGIKDWQHYSWVAEEDGEATFKWEYRPDDSDCEGDNCVYVKNVSLSGDQGGDSPVDLSELAQAMNAPGCTVEYENDSEYPWIVTELDGAIVAKSNHTDPEDGYHQSYVTTTLNVKAGDELSFDYLVSTEEDCDWFIFYANDEDILWDSGIKDWQHYSWVAEENGEVTFKWEYRPDDSDCEGDNCVYVKNVSFSGDAGNGENPVDTVIYPAELAEAISSPVDVTFATMAETGWTSGEGYAVSSAETGSWTETQLFIDINTEVVFEYALTDGALKAYIINDDGQVVTMLSAEEPCDFTEFKYTPPEMGVYTIRFVHNNNGEARIKSFTLEMSKSIVKPATQEQLDAALNAEGGILTFTTWGKYPMYVGHDGERYFAGNTNAGVDATESVVKTVVHLEAGQALLYDTIHLGGDDNIWGNNDFATLDIGLPNGRFSFEDIVMTSDWYTNTFIPTQSGDYTFIWGYRKDRNEGVSPDRFRLDNVRVVELGQTHEYDGKLYGVTNGMWCSFDPETNQKTDIINTPYCYGSLGAAYIPEQNRVYAYAYAGMMFPTAYDANELIVTVDCHNDGNYLMLDSTYDPVDSVIYGVGNMVDPFNGSAYESHLYTIAADDTITKIDLGEMQGVASDNYIMTLAADAWGNLYCTDMQGMLYKLDKETLELTPIGSTGLANPNGYFQSMTYDPVAGKMYISYMGTNNPGGGIYEINTRTAEATLVMDNVGQVTSLFTYTPADFEPGPEPPEFLPGDVDQDGSITVADALLAMRYAMGIIDLTPEQIELAEMDGDGTITIADALIIMRMAMGLV